MFGAAKTVTITDNESTLGTTLLDPPSILGQCRAVTSARTVRRERDKEPHHPKKTSETTSPENSGDEKDQTDRREARRGRIPVNVPAQ